MIWASLIALMFAPQIAINIGEFPASIDFFAYLAFAGLLLVSGGAVISLYRLLLLVLTAVVALVGLKTGSELVSTNSMMLFLVLYFPFAIRPLIDDSGLQAQIYIRRVFVLFATILAVIGCLQLVAVNVFGLRDLANISLTLPEAILAAGRYASTREDAGVVKANGFFLKEASSLSGITALAFVVEYQSRARWTVLLVLLAGLLASASGSGILILLASFTIPTSKRSLLALVVLVALGILIAATSAHVQWLNLWLDRLSEFDTEGSSAHARFIAPIAMIERGFASGSFAMLWGNGPGTYLRSIAALDLRYEISDPTWAKLPYEYGIIGSSLMAVLFTSRLYSGLVCWQLSMAIAWGWIASGAVLKPDFVLLVWLLTLVPKRTRALQLVLRVPRGSNFGPRAVQFPR
jgi:hypothetical protein